MDGPSQRQVQVRIGSREPAVSGLAWVTRWDGPSRWRRGFRLSLKICLMVLGLMLPFAVMEPFLFMVWGGVAFFLVVTVLGPLLFIRFSSEAETFSKVEGPCPSCGQVQTPLKPYLSAEYRPDPEGFTVLCPACGDTHRAVAPSPPEDSA